MGIGMPELILVLVIVLLVFGASRLPQIGEGIGKAVRNLKRGLSQDEEIEVTPKSKRVADKSSAEKVETPEVAEAEVVEKDRADRAG
jgi:sec-independent protein translocase protein TatA